MLPTVNSTATNVIAGRPTGVKRLGMCFLRQALRFLSATAIGPLAASKKLGLK
jgi:hypothetical protein